MLWLEDMQLAKKEIKSFQQQPPEAPVDSLYQSVLQDQKHLCLHKGPACFLKYQIFRVPTCVNILNFFFYLKYHRKLN